MKYIITVKTSMRGFPSFTAYAPQNAPTGSTKFEKVLGEVEASTVAKAILAGEKLFYAQESFDASPLGEFVNSL
jgi:hypothetical protein